MPKVSIIVPVYNVEQYLHECLDSVVNQTLHDIEIICINDGSTDESLKILREYEQKDERIKVISKPNSGYGHTMNVGLDNATGEYIGIVESDDYVALNMYETLYKYAKKHNVDLIKADFYSFTVERDKPKLVYRDLSYGQKQYYHKVLNPSKHLKIFRFMMNTWSGLYKSAFLNKYNIRHNETPGASYQDNGFFFQTFCRASQIYFLDRPLYRHRWDNPQSSINNKNKVYCMKDEYDFIKDFLNKNPDLKIKFIPIYYVKKFHNYMFTYRRIAEEYKRLFLKHFSTEFNEAKKDGELNKEYFTAKEWDTLTRICRDPEAYYFENRVISNAEKWHKELQTARHELKEIRNSYSYKAGRIITFFPRLCCKVIARILKTNKLTMPLYIFLRYTKHHGLKAALQKTKHKVQKSIFASVK